MNLVKLISSSKIGGYLYAKFLRFGDKDVQEKKTVSPYGIDSNPIADMIALYAETTTKGEAVLVGYINKNAVAEPGELRFFSTDTSGVEKSYQWFKADGTIEINGSDDNMVRHSELKEGFDKLRNDVNNLIDSFNVHFHISATAGFPTSGPSATLSQSTASVDDAKIDAIKTSATD